MPACASSGQGARGRVGAALGRLARAASRADRRRAARALLPPLLLLLLLALGAAQLRRQRRQLHELRPSSCGWRWIATQTSRTWRGTSGMSATPPDTVGRWRVRCRGVARAFAGYGRQHHGQAPAPPPDRGYHHRRWPPVGWLGCRCRIVLLWSTYVWLMRVWAWSLPGCSFSRRD
jgi:hypothetical protein